MPDRERYTSVFRPDLFADHVVVVTGGGSGIGRCTAHEVASLGATVVITGRKQEKLDKVCSEIEASGGRAYSRAFDIRDEEAVKTSIKSILAAHGQISGLVNNAGGQFPSPLGMIPKKGWDAVIANNLTGGFLMMREVFLQHMMRNGGAIVNIVADMWNGMPGMAHSGAARAGMVNLTKTAAYEWAAHRIRVNAVAPGWIASSGFDTYDGPTRAMLPKLKNHVPMRRIGTESEVSAAICFLLSPAAAFITGVTIAVDGGAPLGSAIYPTADHAGTQAFDGFHLAVTPDVLRDTDRNG